MEALGLQPAGMAAIPAVDSRRASMSQLAGRRIVDMVNENLRMSDILTRDAFVNAIRVNAALGGSTNAIVHLLALAGRAGVDITLEDFHQEGVNVPLLVDLMPSGKYLMEDFFYAGGVPALMQSMQSMLNLDLMTVNGTTVRENIAGARNDNPDIIRPLDNPVQPAGSGTVVLYGNLAPKGAVLKVSAATPELLTHRGPALVFDSNEDYMAVADDDDLDVTADTVLIVRGGGPKGYPGFPEIGNMPLPKKLLEQGVSDMVRVSDARMSGTGFGTCVLHVAPESAVGGPIGVVHTGDIVELDVKNRVIRVDISDEELENRLSSYTPQVAQSDRGWVKLYVEHVTGADQGADLDFLMGQSGDATPRHSH
jgi:L-arabonate dehydrase